MGTFDISAAVYFLRRRMPLGWMAQKVARCLPGSSAGFGPPRRSCSNPEYARRSGAEWIVSVPSYRPTYTPAVIFGSQALDYGPALAREMPDAGVLRLKDARVFTPRGWVIGEDDHYLPDNSWFGWETRPFGLSIYARARLGPLTHARGTSLNLTSEFATGNYAHLVLDGLSRLHLFLATGMDLASLDHVLVPTRTYPILGRFLSRFGIPKAKVIAANEAAHVRCDKLWAPSFPGRRRNTPYWVVDFWRDGFRSETERPPFRRLYISRRGHRRSILNEADIKPVLDRRGFEEIRGDVDPSVFAEAAVVVGGFGAGLADIITAAREQRSWN